MSIRLASVSPSLIYSSIFSNPKKKLKRERERERERGRTKHDEVLHSAHDGVELVRGVPPPPARLLESDRPVYHSGPHCDGRGRCQECSVLVHSLGTRGLQAVLGVATCQSDCTLYRVSTVTTHLALLPGQTLTSQHTPGRSPGRDDLSVGENSVRR